MKVIIGSDHGGFTLKEEIKKHLQGKKYEVIDYGTYSKDPVDYPDIAYLVAQAVSKDCEDTLGIIVDGAGMGSAIVANKIPGIRAAACYDTFTARNSREHNDANVLTLGERVTGIGLAKEIVDTWLSSAFAGERHGRRVEKIMQIERKHLR